jgi:hypothetical protein
MRREEVTPSASLLSKSFSAKTKSRHGNSAGSKVSRFGNPLTAKRMEVRGVVREEKKLVREVLLLFVLSARAFVLQQPALALKSAAVAGERSVRADHSVTRHHNPNRI